MGYKKKRQSKKEGEIAGIKENKMQKAGYLRKVRRESVPQSQVINDKNEKLLESQGQLELSLVANIESML